jgi:hypothetical protein
MIAAVIEDNGRLVCLIEASSIHAVRRLVALALLPSGRIHEVSHLDAPRASGAPPDPGSDPGSDLGPGFESKLVEDVVDTGLDGSLGDE